MNPDDVCAKHAKAGGRITVTEIDSDMVLIEGTKEDLLFLAELLVAQANFQEDCGLQISLGMNKILRRNSTRGLYIHRIPCAVPSAETSG